MTWRSNVVLASLVLAGCSSQPGVSPFVPYTPDAGSPASIAYDNGLTSGFGHARVTTTTTTNGVTTTEFDPTSGPICMRGAPFRASTRAGASDELLIFLQGGGACWSSFCFAITAAPAGIPPMDVLRVESANPLADADVLYVPYCDGSLFAGDADLDDDHDGVAERHQHGLANLTAALEVGYEAFPHPSRVVLAGSSGGGFGTVLAVFLVRYVYPDVPILVLDDAGVGVAHPDMPTFVHDLLAEWNALRFVPRDCPDCIADGNVTGVVDYALAHDPGLRVAAISSHYDFVISQIFLGLPVTTWQPALIAETDTLHAAHGSAYRRFFYPGDAHTALLGTPTGIIGGDLRSVEIPMSAAMQLSHVRLESIHTATASGTMLDAWLTALLAGDDAHAPDLVADPGPLPAWAM